MEEGRLEMNKIFLHSRSDHEGKLHLEIEVGQANTEYNLEIIVRPKQRFVLPPNYFDIIDSVDDDTLTTHPQPPLPPPISLD